MAKVAERVLAWYSSYWYEITHDNDNTVGACILSNVAGAYKGIGLLFIFWYGLFE